MKVQLKSERDAATLEGGLQQEKQEYISKVNNNTNCCKQWIRCIRLIFLLELTLFFGWGCYMILQSYHSRVMENEEIADMLTRERYLPVFQSVSEVQKLDLTTKMSVTFVKPEIITDKLNNFLGDIKLTKEQGKTIVTDVDNIVQTSTQNSISMLEPSDINNSPMISPSGDLVYDEEFIKNLMPWKSSSNGYTDKIIINNNEDSVIYKQFLEKLQNIAKSVTINDLKQFENSYDFSENDKSLWKPWADEQVDTSLESSLIICPPYQLSESSGISSEHLIKSSLISQSVPVPELLEKIKNNLSNDIKNKDKHDADDNNILISELFDTFASGNNEHFSFDTQIPIEQNVQDQHSSEIIANTKEEEAKYKLMKNIEPNFGLLQSKIQDIAESSTPNVKFQWFNALPTFANDLQVGLKDISESSKIQNSSLENIIENTETNTLIPEKDKSHIHCQTEVETNVFRIKCSEIMIDEEWNFASSDAHTEDFSNVINFKDNFDLYMDYYNDDYDNKDESKQLKDESTSNENFDEKIGSLQHSVPKVTDAVELQGNMPDVRRLKNTFDFLFERNSFDKTEVDKHDEINNPDKEKIKQEISSSSTTTASFTSESDSVDLNKEWNPLLEVSDTQQQKQLKVTEEQDLLNSKNVETFLKSNERVYDLEKKLTSIFNDEMLNIIKQLYPSKSSFEDDYSDICSTSPYFCSLFSNFQKRQQQYGDLKKFLEHIRNHNNPSDIGDDYNYRKKRMADDLTEKYEQVSNTLEEINKNVNVSQNLKKLFQKMEVFAACIDRLHERFHFLNNKLDDDYVSNEFSMETNEHQESNMNL
ncbi:uncharacterized protein LOC126850247 [Cataglyphis hispanica]|uniref:uncharacterized protein LOC126850247 n=1 Tax=Cataglyphis hispanica TaxID=1086592 RepID=UPI0021807828|nr:uncharacterized protein LOC126850247 [Cataglyphis hispanica]